MSDLLSLITPHTTGIIWLTKGEINFHQQNYKDIDYLLNGLLTAGLPQLKSIHSQVFIGKNFFHPIYVLVVNKLDSKELVSFFSLFQKNLQLENKILVIDESDKFNELQKISSKEQISLYQIIKGP